MPSAYVDASQVSFPSKCPHCGRGAETTCEITARRNLDVFFGAYGLTVTVAVPACRASARRRRMLGAGAFVAENAFIFVGGFLALTLALNERKIAAAIIAGAIVAVAILVRVGADDALLDSWALGVQARRVGGPGTRLRVSFRRDDYFSEWAGTNPGASMSGGAIGWRPPSREELEAEPIVFNRVIPAIVLVVVVIAVALHHWYAVNGGHPFVVPLCLLTAAGGLALGGLVYPPVFWSISAHGKRLPMPIKIVGAVFAIAGLAAGFVLGISYSR